MVWTTFPGYTDGLLPASDRLFAFTPVWRNFSENLYLIQACHRLLSIALWGVALAWLVAAMLRRRDIGQPAMVFGLLTLEGALGVAALVQGEPLVISIAHQVGAIFVLAAALAPATEQTQCHAHPPTTIPGTVTVPFTDSTLGSVGVNSFASTSPNSDR